MGLTLIQKSDDARRKRSPKVALVLAGGAVSGGSFKIGGLKALNDYLSERKITDLDIYVGLSAGSILSASLASGITPDEMLRVLDGTSTKFDQLRPIPPNHDSIHVFLWARLIIALYKQGPRYSESSDTPRDIPPRQSHIQDLGGRFFSSIALRSQTIEPEFLQRIDGGLNGLRIVGLAVAPGSKIIHIGVTAHG